MPPKQYSKFKPWRKGKSAEKRLGAAAGGKKMSLKNRLRGQRRLLAKLTEKGESGDGLEGVKAKIAELEKEVKEREAREREKKNSTKYHQVKFIERQKVTRLEKSIQRQLQKLKEEYFTDNDKAIQEQITKLQAQLSAAAMDQLYIAFYPADVKYMSLFTNGMQRAVDDERGQKRRKNIWNRIREGLLNDLKNENEGGSAYEEDGTKEKKVQLDNAKNWVNLDAAKKALLSMPVDTYPNAPSLLPIIVSDKRQQSKSKHAKRESTDSTRDEKATVTDDRFVFSKELDGLFHESTTGDDYEKVMEMQDANQKPNDDAISSDSDGSSDSDDNDSSSEDDADPLKGYAKSKDIPGALKNRSSEDDDKVKKSTKTKVANEESSSSSSSDGSDSSDSHSDAVPPNTKENADNNVSVQNPVDDAEEDDDSDQDDFFTTEKVSTEEVFSQAQNQPYKERTTDDHYHYQKKRSDKSKGFATQNQTKREFRNFQHRKKRSKFG